MFTIIIGLFAAVGMACTAVAFLIVLGIVWQWWLDD